MYQDTAQAAHPETISETLLARARAQFATPAALAATLDHTQLKPEATAAQVKALCTEAAEHRFACAMVNPAWIPLAASELRGSGVRIGTVLGFPLGASLTDTKVAEAHHAAQAGALDLDMVLNIGALRSGLHDAVAKDIRAVAEAAHGEGAILKVILETCLLTDEQKRLACELAAAAGADFVKTSTGFSSGGATEADIQLMRATVGPAIGVKASGGIRTLEDAVRMAEAGANRIGASASVAIVETYARFA
jgi:deoxyribose-phosphate aldolase